MLYVQCASLGLKADPLFLFIRVDVYNVQYAYFNGIHPQGLTRHVLI
jgi:hypothetical protein